jgi:hypothetical protein
MVTKEELAQTVTRRVRWNVRYFSSLTLPSLSLLRLIPTATEAFVQERMTASHANPPLLIPHSSCRVGKDAPRFGVYT